MVQSLDFPSFFTRHQAPFFTRHQAQALGSKLQAPVARVAKAWIKPARMPIIVVGPRAEFEARLEALELGPLTVK